MKESLDAIKNTIQMEKDGYSFYIKAASQTTSEMGKKIFESLVDRLDKILKDPEEHRKRVILTRDIPNLQFRLDKLKNTYDVKSHRWTDLKKENHKLSMMNVKSHIVALINRVVGINMVQVKA